MRRSLLRAGLVGVAGVLAVSLTSCSSCGQGGGGGAGAAKEDTALLPKESTIVASFNFPRMRDTSIWRKGIEMRDKGDPAAKAKYDEFVKATGFDPFTQLDSLLVGIPQPADSGEFAAVLHGTFSEEKLVAWAKEQAKKDGQELMVEEYGGKKIYKDKNGSGGVVFLDAKTIAVGGKGWAKRMIDLAAGKPEGGGSVQDNAALVAVIKKARTSDAIWGAGLVPDAAKQKIQQMSQVEGAKTITDAYGSIDFAGGLKIQLVLDLADAAEAEKGAAKLKETLADLKKNPRVAVLGMGSFIDAVMVGADKGAFKVDISYTQAQVDDLIARVQGLLGKGK